jgi:hypothetical protein
VMVMESAAENATQASIIALRNVNFFKVAPPEKRHEAAESESCA